MGVHQLFFPLVGETNEHVLARALQSLSVISDKVHEALNVDVIFKVHGQNVSHFRSSRRSYVSPIGNSALERLSESKPLNRVHSTIELPVTTRHCGYSLVEGKIRDLLPRMTHADSLSAIRESNESTEPMGAYPLLGKVDSGGGIILNAL